MLPVVFVLLAIALVVGPIMMMQPNSRQRKEIACRERAATLGLKVHLLPMPEAGGSRPVPAYCLPWKSDRADLSAWILVRSGFEHELHFQGLWQWAAGSPAAEYWHPAIRQALEQLPDSVLALGNGPQGLSIFWNETGDLAQLDTFLTVLQTLSGGAARGRPRRTPVN